MGGKRGVGKEVPVILLDTDVLIDLALDREPHAGAAAALIDHLERAPRMAFVAWHTISNFYYLVRPARGGAAAKDFIEGLIRFVTVAPTDTEALRYATSLRMRDFEDTMQVAVARACGAEFIVTRNTKDFRQSPIAAKTPAEALLWLT